MKTGILFDIQHSFFTITLPENVCCKLIFLCEILKNYKENGMHIAVNMAGNVPFGYFGKILPYTDLFLYDIKI